MFNQDWKYTVHSGLNLMLGVNAIGKTTTTNIVTYGLVGSHKGFHEILNPDYFLQRLENYEELIVKNNLQPSVRIDIQIGVHSISFSRSLTKDTILALTIDKKKIPNHDELKEQYEDILKKFTGFTDLNDLQFLISHLLIREEEGNYLLWDLEAQSRVMRLLLNYSGFSDEFKKLEDELQTADTAYKREKDFMGRLEKRKRELEDDRKSKLSNNKDFVKREDVSQIISKLRAEREDIIKNKDFDFANSIQLKEKLRDVLNELDTLKSNYEESSEELNSLESRFYQSSFEDHRGEFIFSKITNRSICMVCNNNVSQTKVTEIVRKVKTLHECPVCSSELKNVENIVESLTAREVKRMESLEKTVKQSYPVIVALQKEYEKLFTQVEETNKRILANDQKLTELNINIAINTSKLDQIVNNSETPMTNFDFAIAELQNQIEVLRETTEPLLAQFNSVKRKMEAKNDELNKVIDNYHEKLVEIYSSISKNYFGKTSSLLLISRKPKGFEVPLKYFIPLLNGKERYFQTRVSKSQAIFMEYLFRLSLLKLYFQNTDIKPFLFLETSEGSFDVSNTEIMADTLTQIGKIGFPFVIITNLSKIDFIKHLLPDVIERKKRTFNLLTFANASVFDGRSKKALLKALKELEID